MSVVVTLADTSAFEPWRQTARAALQREVPPEQIVWCLQGKNADLFSCAETTSFTGEIKRDVRLKASNLPVLKDVLCHSSPERFALAYRLLWRLQEDPDLLSVPTDPDVGQARRMVQQVRRAAHKMTAFVRFREQDPTENGRRRFLSWFEPDHHVLEKVSSFFAKRFADMDWLILTPRGSISWNGTTLNCSFKPCEKQALEDDVEQLWQTYYASTFNPARVRTKAMRNEMPRRYWKNLPEAALIPQLVAEAEKRVAEMAAREALPAPKFHQAIQARQSAITIQAHVPGSMTELAQDIRACRACSLQCHATQAVVGEGPETAKVMIVGEQPGDQEDLAGRPFVGPAGQLLMGCLEEAGVAREALYLTNAVKHFRFTVNGRRRIHQAPGVEHISACQPWLKREIALVKPKLIVSLGATALRAVSGPSDRLKDVRGTLQEHAGEGWAHLTLAHPSWILRLGPTDQAERERQALIAGLSKIKGVL
ncbi:UdgX family uracil-DNA binding protein [Gluconobacter japonicus]|uniref:Type-4 uracil-DNA glycosylase n=1 Tax=Gluconobacter japonicus TaxID=376620 RepID=A0ABQ5WF90_GLUJA|nr:UdgX family uracil-DNA binding protein [Gluconobacter japonicus]KXV29304.1 DNA polymerase [Gluconobacter japonicus]GBR22820.1 uracil-DNA glycosylase [Gluconobacter japonicus NBRC 3271]GLQ58802.1 uracil-DNA glycosylase [Gluconobacter japonicus]